MVTSEGQWAWDHFHHLLSNDVLEYIAAVKALGPSSNQKIFDLDAIDGGDVLERSRRLAMEATHAIKLEHLYHRSNSSVRQPSVRWNPPRSGVWKLNVDGARNLADGSASCGGVIRDSHGTWIVGFSKYIGKCSALEA
ncbi:hypothetical protein V6N11_061713 [Hibiscus sabdariffa]|uniref:Uncharacterized protein n=2 Tax=Hibiscus sabdariffa TaxID=183260 RepID=A0ABR2BXX4_9ROSI